MSPAVRPRRPLPARVYWVRRGLVLSVALGLVFGIAHLLGGTGSEPAGEAAQVVGAAADGSPSTTQPLSTATAGPRTLQGKRHRPKATKTETPLAEPSGPCLPSDVVATPKVKGTAYAAHRVTFRIKLTTLESPACTWRVSPSTLAVKLVSGSDRIWSSQDCPAAVPTTDVVVRKDHPAKVDVHWRGRRSDSTCSQIPDWALPGWYHIEAAAFGAEPTDVQFELEWPVSRTITATPKPEKKPEDEKSDAEPEEKKSDEKKSDRRADQPSDEASAD
jgi:hypothetical protein